MAEQRQVILDDLAVGKISSAEAIQQLQGRPKCQGVIQWRRSRKPGT